MVCYLLITGVGDDQISLIISIKHNKMININKKFKRREHFQIYIQICKEYYQITIKYNSAYCIKEKKSGIY